MLANLIRAGVQTDAADVNAVFESVGLPPIAYGIISSNAINAADKVAKHLTAQNNQLTNRQTASQSP